MKTLAAEKLAHQRYILKAKARGDRVLSYVAPCCGEHMETLAPQHRHVIWDTFATCPACGSLYLKVVTFETASGLLPKTAGDQGE